MANAGGKFSAKQFTVAMGRVNIPLVIGFALCQLWVTLCFFTPQLFPGNPGSNVYGLSLAVTALVSIGAMLRHHRFDVLLKKPAMVYGIAASAAVGTLLIPLVSGTGPWFLALTITAAVLTGLASSLFFMAWYQKFTEAGSAVDCVLSITTYSVFLYVLTRLLHAPAMSPWITLALTAATPLCAALILNRRMPPARPFPSLAVPTNVTSLNRFIVKFCFGLFATSFVSEFLRSYLLERNDLNYYSSEINLLILLFKIGCSVGIIIIVQTRRTNDFSFLYRTSFLLIMLSALLLPHIPRQEFLYAFTNAGAFLFKLVIMLIALELCQRFKASPSLVFGATRAAWSLDLLLGSSLFAVYQQLSGTYPQLLQTISLFLVVVVVVAFLFVFTERDRTSILSPQEDAETTSTQSRCEAIALHFDLSERETEVLHLVAKGRSTPRIQEELHISAHTVNSHIQHVYQKLKVHSRQEILDVVDAWQKKSD